MDVELDVPRGSDVSKKKTLEKLGRLIIHHTTNTGFPFNARLISYESGDLLFTRGGITEKDSIERLHDSVKEYLWNTTNGRRIQ
jgi:hypothetical protein